MENKDKQSDHLDSEIETSGPARSNFLHTVNETENEDERRQAFTEFVDALQQEADARWAGPSRDLWINYHLSLAYVMAEMWEYAQEAIDDLHTLEINHGQTDIAFEKLRQKIAIRQS